MNSAMVLGLVAGGVTSLAVVPQVVKAYRSKQVRDLSIWQPVLLVAGMLLWLAYGLMINDVPLIAANIFSISCNGLLIVMKFRYRGGDNGVVGGYSLDTIKHMEDL
ncbi:MAG: hypothetical protein ED859_13835 [Desulfuromonadales bacterium]|nr:MAG: hypothetical protein ED859_13835 [Desulfuromonadales bacterium]